MLIECLADVRVLAEVRKELQAPQRILVAVRALVLVAVVIVKSSGRRCEDRVCGLEYGALVGGGQRRGTLEWCAWTNDAGRVFPLG